MFIDTHAHINFGEFKDDAFEVIRNSLNEEIWMVVPGSDYKSSRRALEYANKYEKGVYAAIGLHPVHILNPEVAAEDTDLPQEEFNYDSYEQLAKFEKTVAIGEIGLDYYHISQGVDASAIKKRQKDTFVAQMELGIKKKLPAIIHCRQAHDDMVEVIKDFKRENKDWIPRDRPWGVMHCFSGDEDLAWQYFSFGLIISFTGLITFSKQWDDLIRKLPDDKYMIETDSPFMTPEPFRGQRNEPLLVGYVAERIAEIKHLSIEKVANITTRNAKALFKI